MPDAAADIRFLYVPFPGDFDVAALGGQAIEQQLCACVNFWAGRSVYQWEGKLHNDGEQFALFKTTAARESALRSFLAEGHPYDLPCIAALSPCVNPAFADFVAGCCGGAN